MDNGKSARTLSPERDQANHGHRNGAGSHLGTSMVPKYEHMGTGKVSGRILAK